jgi:hypothetical protein
MSDVQAPAALMFLCFGSTLEQRFDIDKRKALKPRVDVAIEYSRQPAFTTYQLHTFK